jgi:hypothetical protein
LDLALAEVLRKGVSE